MENHRQKWHSIMIQAGDCTSTLDKIVVEAGNCDVLSHVSGDILSVNTTNSQSYYRLLEIPGMQVKLTTLVTSRQRNGLVA